MKKLYVFSSVISLLIALTSCSNPGSNHFNDILWYDEPAHIWEESVPLGNGRLGMMPRGGIVNEHIILNEISMWSGSEFDYRNPEASRSLPKIRQLLFEGKNYEAQQLMFDTFVPKTTSGNAYGAYQILANLDITFDLDTAAGVTNYHRQLDMSSGVASTSFDVADNHISREYFTSRSEDVMVIRLSSTKPLSFTARLTRPECAESRSYKKNVVLAGQLNSGQEGVAGVKYKAIMTLQNADQINCSANDNSLRVNDATDVVLLISANTSLLGGINYQNQTSALLDKALAVKYADLLAAHSAAHSALYNRVRINIEGNGDSILTTDQRVVKYGHDYDPAMAVLYYNFGRYSLISSTRPKSLPPNLQGLWANDVSTPWNGDYHTNINVQMNHWPLESGNLDELYEPLIRLVEGSVSSGEESAHAFYGDSARGWVMHMMTNVWNFTAPGEHPSWGATNTGGAWLCQHLYERYEYTLDTIYLSSVFPVLRGAAEFFESTMVTEPQHGWLVTAPTSSPENSFYTDDSDEPVSVCMGPTMDIEIIRELYSNVIHASEILGINDPFIRKLKTDIRSLPPLQISSKGYLQEWLEDYREVDTHHRHVSHLYGLHPSNQISPIETPELADACRQTLNRRGDNGTGWSRAWKINFWARLFDGNRAEHLLHSLLQSAISKGGNNTSGTFPNLWCSHPPFQLDGNFGGASGIGEMLLQSHMGYVNPLPALPSSWKNGSVYGMKVRGGAEVSLVWRTGKLRTMTFSGGKQRIYKVVVPKGCDEVILQNDKGSQKLKFYSYFNIRMVEVPMSGSKATLVFD